MSDIDITVIVNAHEEGLLAVPTLKSVERAVAVARDNGLAVEIIVVLDRPNADTQSLLFTWANAVQSAIVEQVEFGDLGYARNHGVSIARGRWVVFIDSDDLWSRNWLIAAFHAAESEGRPVVWHPEVNLFFGKRSHVFVHTDMDSKDFDISGLAHANLWTALCFTNRALLIKVPYSSTNLKAQIGFEDWGWNMEVIGHGAVHKIVSNTVHAIRTKDVSLVTRTTTANCLPNPTNLFRTILAGRKSQRTIGARLVKTAN